MYAPLSLWKYFLTHSGRISLTVYTESFVDISFLFLFPDFQYVLISLAVIIDFQNGLSNCLIIFYVVTGDILLKRKA